MTFLRGSSKYHFRWILYSKRKWHNNRRKQQLISKNYKFVDVERFEKLRNYDWNKQFVWDETQTTEDISKHNTQILSVTKQITYNNINLIDMNRPNKKRKLIYSPENDNLRNHNDNSNNYIKQKKKRRLF